MYVYHLSPNFTYSGTWYFFWDQKKIMILCMCIVYLPILQTQGHDTFSGIRQMIMIIHVYHLPPHFTDSMAWYLFWDQKENDDIICVYHLSPLFTVSGAWYLLWDQIDNYDIMCVYWLSPLFTVSGTQYLFRDQTDELCIAWVFGTFGHSPLQRPEVSVVHL